MVFHSFGAPSSGGGAFPSIKREKDRVIPSKDIMIDKPKHFIRAGNLGEYIRCLGLNVISPCVCVYNFLT